MDIRLISIGGSSAHNAIAREAEAIVACDPEQFPVFEKLISSFEKTVQSEYASTEKSPALTLSKTETDILERLTREDTDKVIHLLLALPHGVAEMSADVEGLVETLPIRIKQVCSRLPAVLRNMKGCTHIRISRKQTNLY